MEKLGFEIVFSVYAPNAAIDRFMPDEPGFAGGVRCLGKISAALAATGAPT
jgi:hypothetical protein